MNLKQMSYRPAPMGGAAPTGAGGGGTALPLPTPTPTPTPIPTPTPAPPSPIAPTEGEVTTTPAGPTGFLAITGAAIADFAKTTTGKGTLITLAIVALGLIAYFYIFKKK